MIFVLSHQQTIVKIQTPTALFLALALGAPRLMGLLGDWLDRWQ